MTADKKRWGNACNRLIILKRFRNAMANSVNIAKLCLSLISRSESTSLVQGLGVEGVVIDKDKDIDKHESVTVRIVRQSA